MYKRNGDASRENTKNRNARWRERGGLREWCRNNPDRIKTYQEQHRIHNIVNEEWFACLDYFNNSCAYCNLTDEEQLILYNERLHKEHVIHNGSNYIDNCVPSCKACNASKSDKEFNDWYNEDNITFTQERLDKIVRWMTSDCFDVLNIE